MNPQKGDLVLVSDGEITTTCIILTTRYNMTSSVEHDFYYSYCIDTGLFGLVYGREIISIVSENFAPNFEFESELFETDYAFYADLYERFSYYPKMFPPDEDSSDED
jgi:hypothetical protein